MNINNPTTFATPDLTLSTSNSSGTSGALRADDTILVYDATVPSTIGAGDSPGTGDSATAARRNHVHGSAAAYTTFAAPSFTLGTSNISGSGDSVHAGATLLAFDTTLPDSIAFGQSASAGSAVVCARRDHSHGMAADPSGLVLIGTVEASADDSLTVTGLSSTYDSYLILISDLHPTSNGNDLRFRVGDAAGIDSGAGDYAYICQTLLDSSTSYASEVSSSATSIIISDTGQGGPGTDTGEGFGAALWLHRPGDGVVNPLITGHYAYLDGGDNLVGGSVFGERTAVITLDRVEISLTASTLASGRMSVWGYSHA